MAIQIACELPAGIDEECLMSKLPQTKTKVVQAKCTNHQINLKLFTTCHTVKEIKQWIYNFEKASQASYSISSTKDVTERYISFKQYLHCRHNTKSKKLYNSSNSNSRIRNTDCPSTLKVTLHAEKKRYQSKDKARNELLKEMRCEIDLILTHNHDLDGTAALSFRKVSNDVKEKLMDLYGRGHSPATALQIIKMDIYMNCNNWEKILADRMHCPEYNYCYNVYKHQFKEKYGSVEFDSLGKDFLKKRVEEYNEQLKDNCAQLVLHGEDYVICICPPLLKRVHQVCQSALEIVFMDSGTCDDGQIFILLTHGGAGGLPLGVIIMSSASTVTMQIGFKLLKDMLGSTIFGGNLEGPKIFLINDSVTEQSAVKAVWTKSTCLLCSFHVLRAVWKWLMKITNNIPKEYQYIYFQNFKTILFSETIQECFEVYELAKSNIAHENYLQYLEEYWQRKQLWALCYRNMLLPRGNNLNNSEATMKIIKDKIFNRTNAFNVVQLVDFMLTKFVQYYQICLLDATNNRQMKSTVKLPATSLLESISVLSEDCLFVSVPSETSKLEFIVNLDALTCSCFQGLTGKLCKHIHWAAIKNPSANYNLRIDNINIQQFTYIATGANPDNNWCLPVVGDHEYAATLCDSDSDMENVSTYENDVLCESEDILINREELINEKEKVQVVVETVSTSEKNIVLDLQDILIKREELKNKAKEKVQVILQEFSKICELHIERSVEDLEPALQQMLDNMKKIKSASALASSCSSFAALQPTGISRRKAMRLGRKLGGRPRNKNHKLEVTAKNSENNFLC